MNNDIEFNVVEVNKSPISVDIKDKDYNLKFVLADTAIIPKPATLKQLPKFEVKIDMDAAFTDKFLKALRAVNAASVAFKPNDGNIDVVIGYSATTNSNSIKFNNTATCTQTDPVTTFACEHLKNVLTANKGLAGSIEISSQGLMKLTFNNVDFDNEYFLVQASLN